jgi:hypothetical protein
MKTAYCLMLPLLCLLARPAFAQTPGSAPTDLKPVLRTLTSDQKVKLLQYMRSLGTSLDKECQQVYEQLNSEKRGRVIQYTDILNQDPDVAPGRTAVVWKRDTVHFGKVHEGSILFDSFTVVNKGAKPYIIKSVKTSCDCTVVRYPEFPVMPGETASIRVEFDSRGKSGHTEPGIIVYDNSIPNSRNILYLKGEVLTDDKKVKRVKER